MNIRNLLSIPLPLVSLFFISSYHGHRFCWFYVSSSPHLYTCSFYYYSSWSCCMFFVFFHRYIGLFFFISAWFSHPPTYFSPWPSTSTFWTLHRGGISPLKIFCGLCITLVPTFGATTILCRYEYHYLLNFSLWTCIRIYKYPCIFGLWRISFCNLLSYSIAYFCVSKFLYLLLLL